MPARTDAKLTVDELRRLVSSGEIDTVLTVFPDLYGRLVGKRIIGGYFLDEVLRDGMHVCDYLLACDMEMDPVPGYRFTSWAQGYGDMRCVPDVSTLRRASWLERTALVICDCVLEHGDAPVAVAPRTILKRQVERAKAAGFAVMAASELEFFVLRDSFATAERKHFHDLEPFGWYAEDYHTFQGRRMEPLVGAIRQHLERSAVPVEFSKGEWSPGQHEINLRYADALETADRHVVYKQAAKEIADQQGVALTFMAKMDERYAGSSMHVHSSLWSADGTTPLFPSDGPAIAGTPVQGTDRFRWWLGGLMTHARASTFCFAPYPNSYKRYVAGTFAPTAIAWSYDNRTAGFRVVGHGKGLRVECRVPGADANPYLALAATIAAGLDGIARRLEPPPMFSGDVYKAVDLPQLPRTLPEAVAEFERSALFRETFGADVVEHLVHFGRTEQRKFDEVVTSWERRRYLERA